MRSSILAACFLPFATLAVQAHEFWLQPHDYTVERGERIVADIRVGQTFNGAAYAFVPQNFLRFDIASGGAIHPAAMRAGDRPALDVEAAEDGLAVLIHVTRDYTLTYSDPELFRNFVTHKDAAWVLDRHAERGLPDVGFVERYSRYAKSLVAVGDGAGADAAFGLLTEIVALADPYTDDLAEGLPVRVLYQGAPRADAQVEVFARRDGEVQVTTTKTGEDGIALIQVSAGTEYMLDSVVLREVAPGAGDGAVWESLWANLTFSVPD